MTTILLAKELIAQKSITPSDLNCQDIVKKRLDKLNFYHSNFSKNKVINSFFVNNNEKIIDFCFLGHTDVVPAEDLENWKTPPFKPTVKDNILYGRGACDMKSSIAAFIIALENFFKKYPKIKKTIAVILTSDEEGDAIDGTKFVIKTLKDRNYQIKSALVGEPTSSALLGDAIKIGRKGSLSVEVTFKGKAGHVAYSDYINPADINILFLNRLRKLFDEKLEQKTKEFSQSRLAITNIKTNSNFVNVTPCESSCSFNIRFNNKFSLDYIKESIYSLLSSLAKEIDSKLYFKFNALFKVNSFAFLSENKNLASLLQKVVKKNLNINSEFSTSGGTSDAKFLSNICSDFCEFGPVNKTIHQANECINISDLEKLQEVYFEVLKEKLL